MKNISILAICGSLRAVSLNRAALGAAAQLAPAGISLHLYEGIGQLPLFNPDIDQAGGPQVDDWRSRIDAADALLIGSPEYAHGITGVMKNALDWAVSMETFPGKPVALLNTSPRATHAQDSLHEILTTMSARIIAQASISLPLQGSGLDTAAAVLARADLAASLEAALLALAQAVRQGAGSPD
jgi:chromate reductase